MKDVNSLGISPWPWESHKQFVIAKDDGSVVAASNYKDARLIAASPELYEALRDCCEEANGHDAPRCYACRRGEDGHCMARCICKIYKALAKASGESEVK